MAKARPGNAGRKSRGGTPKHVRRAPTRRSPRKKNLKYPDFKGMCGGTSGHQGYVLVSRGGYVTGKKAKSKARKLRRERIAFGSYLRA